MRGEHNVIFLRYTTKDIFDIPALINQQTLAPAIRRVDFDVNLIELRH